MPRKPKTKPSIDSVVKKHEARILQIPGVTGLGIGENDRDQAPAIKVYVERMTPELRKKLPEKLDGYPVVAEATGEFYAF